MIQSAFHAKAGELSAQQATKILKLEQEAIGLARGTQQMLAKVRTIKAEKEKQEGLKSLIKNTTAVAKGSEAGGTTAGNALLNQSNI